MKTMVTTEESLFQASYLISFEI